MSCNVGGWTPAFENFVQILHGRSLLASVRFFFLAHFPTPYLLVLGAIVVFFPFAVQVVVVVMRRRVFASEACFTLSNHCSMVMHLGAVGVSFPSHEGRARFLENFSEHSFS